MRLSGGGCRVALGVFAGVVGFLAFVSWWAAFALTEDAALAAHAATWAGFGAAEAGLFVFLVLLLAAFFGWLEPLGPSTEFEDYPALLLLLFLGGGFLGVLACAHWAILAEKQVGDLVVARACLALALVFPVAALVGLAVRKARERKRTEQEPEVNSACRS